MHLPAEDLALSLGWSRRGQGVLFACVISAAVLLATALPPMTAQRTDGAFCPADTTTVTGVSSPKNPFAECDQAVRLSKILQAASQQKFSASVVLVVAHALSDRAFPVADYYSMVAAKGHGALSPLYLLI